MPHQEQIWRCYRLFAATALDVLRLERAREARLTPTQAANFLGVSVGRLREEAQRGMRAYRAGRGDGTWMLRNVRAATDVEHQRLARVLLARDEPFVVANWRQVEALCDWVGNHNVHGGKFRRVVAELLRTEAARRALGSLGTAQEELE